ncbi:MAG: hypothetical protein ABSC21_14110 [Terriglobia bacterium]
MKLRDHPKLRNIWSALPWSGESYRGIGNPMPTPGETRLIELLPDDGSGDIVLVGEYLGQRYPCYFPPLNDETFTLSLRRTLGKAVGLTILQIGDPDVDEKENQ